MSHIIGRTNYKIIKFVIRNNTIFISDVVSNFFRFRFNCL